MSRVETDWTDALIAQLGALWDEGHSTAEIGRRIGVSKNAVVGKAHRLDLPSRPSPLHPISHRVRTRIVRLWNTQQYTPVQLAYKFRLHVRTVQVLLRDEREVGNADPYAPGRLTQMRSAAGHASVAARRATR